MMGFFLGALMFSGSDVANIYSTLQGQQYIQLYTDYKCKREIMVNTSSITAFRKNRQNNNVDLYSVAGSRYYLCTSYENFLAELKKSTEAVKKKMEACKK